MKGFNMKAVPLIVAISALLLAGCATMDTSKAFRSDGLPKQQYYVGGGFSLYYQAAVPGTVYVVEEYSDKLLITQSLIKTEYYSLDVDPTEEDVQLRMKSIGVDPAQMKLGLYFVPSHAVEEATEE